MLASSLRVQLVADVDTINAIHQSAGDEMSAEPINIPTNDQKFGVAELAAIIVIAKGIAEIAELLAKAYRTFRGSKTITIKTPKGTVTIEGDASITTETIRAQLEAAAVV